MPLTAKGKRILAAMQKEYGDQEGKRVFYASANAGTITGVHMKSKRKKKRSPAQIRATKRLVALNKKRRKKKANPSGSRKTKRKAKRKTNRRAPSPQYQVASLSRKTKRVEFYDGVSWSGRPSSARWGNKKRALSAARRCGRQCAVVTTRDSVSTIKAALTGKA